MEAFLKNPDGFNINLSILQQFEDALDPRHHEQNPIPARVLGYGEISTVFEIQAQGLEGLALKRLSIFQNEQELEVYLESYDRYNALLEENIGIPLPSHGYAGLSNLQGLPIFYIIQKQEPAESIAHKTIHHMEQEETLTVFQDLLSQLRKVWDFNQRQDQIQIGIDGQMSNWVISKSSPTGFLYLDTSTPLFRIDGVEQLNPELFLRSAPSFLRWVLRLFFLDDVVNRYYDFHLVVVDIIAQFYKEQLPELIPDLVSVANAFFDEYVEGAPDNRFTEKEIEDYYREDAFIWSLYLNMRKLDRFIQTRLLRRYYPYILPGKIKR